VPTGQIAGLHAGLCLLQHTDDLLIRNPLAFHLVRRRLGRTLIATGGIYPWQVTPILLNGANNLAEAKPGAFADFLDCKKWLYRAAARFCLHTATSISNAQLKGVRLSEPGPVRAMHVRHSSTVKFSDTACLTRMPYRGLGSHTRIVLSRGGFAAEKVVEIVASQVVSASGANCEQYSGRGCQHPGLTRWANARGNRVRAAITNEAAKPKSGVDTITQYRERPLHSLTGKSRAAQDQTW